MCTYMYICIYVYMYICIQRQTAGLMQCTTEEGESQSHLLDSHSQHLHRRWKYQAVPFNWLARVRMQHYTRSTRQYCVLSLHSSRIERNGNRSSARPNQWFMLYVPLQLNRFHEGILLIVQYKYLKSCWKNGLNALWSATNGRVSLINIAR